MTNKTKHLEVCIGEITPRDEYCKACLEDNRNTIKAHYCYVPCFIDKTDIAMPLPLSDSELETEFMANYNMIMDWGNRR
jgi:hypothetical protein